MTNSRLHCENEASRDLINQEMSSHLIPLLLRNPEILILDPGSNFMENESLLLTYIHFKVTRREKITGSDKKKQS